MSETPKKTNGAKNPRVNIQFNEEQKEVHEKFYQYDVNFILGKHGSGKTLVATAISILAYRKKLYEKIWITNKITKNSVGILPGFLEDKMKQWVYPIIHNFNKCQSSAQTEKMQKEEHIEILPVDFMMGITMNDILIVDEFQNLTEEEFRGVISRLGNKGKIFFCGDPKQTKSSVTNSCFNLAHKLKDSGLVGWSELTSNHRNPALPLIFDILDN